jgi:hypothetical protein
MLDLSEVTNLDQLLFILKDPRQVQLLLAKVSSTINYTITNIFE